jgi:TetR/AcrR family fatty acid metabolism transcriptional regulator
MVHAKRQKRSLVADKRKEILNSAIEVFAQKGYNNANIVEVAAKAGVASGTVYLYFKNKDDLLLQAMKTMMDSNLEEIKAKADLEEKSIDKLFMFFYHHIEVFAQKPSMARFLIVELRQSEEFYKLHPSYNPYHDYQDYVQELVRNSIKEGTTKPFKPETISYLILGVMDTVLTEWLINPDKIDLESVTNELREIIRFGIRTNDK